MRLPVLALVLLMIVPAAQGQVAPVELQHGEQISVACAPAPPTCPPSCGDGVCDPSEGCSCTSDCGLSPASEVGLCADGIDSDCDGLTDCADSDCSAEAACAPVTEPPQSGLQAWHRWDSAHAVAAGQMPVQTVCGMGNEHGCAPPVGSEIHHLLDMRHSAAVVRQATETSELYWPAAEAAAIDFAGDDQLLFQTCTSLDPLICTIEDIDVPASTPFGVVFVGTFKLSGKWIGTSLAPDAIGLTYMDNSGGHIRVRIGASGRVTVLTEIPFDTPVALFIERLADDSLRAWARLPCGAWVDGTANVAAIGRAGTWGCWGCYYPNGWDGGAGPVTSPGTIRFREGLFYAGAELDTAARSDLFGYLDAEHGAWIDAGCGP